MRTKLFISHATPTDNEFAAWLAAKLELHGYDVWVDIRELDPATDFWNTIETEIRDSAIKFLFVATTASVLGNRDGVKKELAVADRVRKSGVSDFIVPLRADGVSFDDFPVEILRQNAIDFNGNWASGLISLLDYLEKQGVSKTNKSVDRMAEALKRWKAVSTSESSMVITTNDNYCSNLFPVKLPEFLYVYNDASIDPMLREKHKPSKKFGDCILTFVCPDCVTNYCGYAVEHQALEIKSLMKRVDPINPFGVEIKRPSSICVSLINWEICEIFYSRGMRLYKPTEKMESKRRYFFKRGIKSKRHEKAVRPKALSGNYKGKNWHYAQSAYFTTAPFTGVLFRSHLLFTDSNNDSISDAQQLSARRSKGKRFFNNDWRDLLQAAMFSHAEGNVEIAFNICCEQSRLSISRDPYTFKATKGYVEPNIDPADSADGGFDDEDE